ncbi:MAG: hypothetical protein GX425_10990 [Peptococcaceae bacterium]|nr:hypothetical protein [Peptococcaceae bacterium]
MAKARKFGVIIQKECDLLTNQNDAREINNIYWSQAMENLQKKCLGRKEPEFYLSS